VEPIAVATPAPAEPAIAVPEATPEAVSVAAAAPEPLDTHASLTDRSGQRTEEEDVTLASADPAEKQANVLALRAAAPVVSLAQGSGLLKASPTPKPPTPKPTATPKPKPVVRAVAPTPTAVRRLTSSGGWVELPNVRPIPSTYYNAVHRWDSIVNHFAGVYRIDPDLIRRIIYVESKGYQYAYVGSTGVKGLMQIAPVWFKSGENPYDPYTNIGKGAYILRRGYDAYHTWFLAVTYYCYGPLGRYGGNVPTMYAGLIYSPIIRSL
jgi:soluble lytic murein transglycosylase-like protein